MKRLKKTRRPIILTVNKQTRSRRPEAQPEYQRLLDLAAPRRIPKKAFDRD